jgi:hypothetical protein
VVVVVVAVAVVVVAAAAVTAIATATGTDDGEGRLRFPSLSTCAVEQPPPLRLTRRSGVGVEHFGPMH